MKIRQKLIFSFGLLAGVLIATIFVSFQYLSRDVLIRLVGNYNTLLAKGYAGEIDRIIYQRIERWEAYVYSNTDLTQALENSNLEYDKMENRESNISQTDAQWVTAEAQTTTDFMKSILENPISIGLKNRTGYYEKLNGYPIFPEFIVTNKYGVNIAQTNRTSDWYQADEDWWQSTVKDKIWVSDVIYDESSHTRDLEIGIRIDGGDGQLLGVAKVVYDLRDIFKVIDDVVSPEGDLSRKTVDAYLLTVDDKLIYSVRDGFMKLADGGYLVQGFDNNKAFYVGNILDEEKLLAHSHLEGYSYYRGQGWQLVISKNTKESLGILNEVRQGIGISAGLGLVVAFGVIWYISGTIASPIKKLHHGTEEIEKGNWDHKVGTKAKDEIGQLSRSFDKMVTAIKESRSQIDHKVEEQTREIVEKNQTLEDQQKAVMNILEDLEMQKNQIEVEKDKVDAILHSIGDGVFVVDCDLKIVLINKVAADMSEYAVEEIIGKNYNQYLKFVSEDNNEQLKDSFIRKAMETGMVSEMSNHTQLVSRSGKKIAVADSAAPLKDKDGKVIGCVVVFRDVTREREIDRMKTEFISVASHQLRTPLGSMRWNLELLLGGDMGELNGESKEAVTQVYESNKRLINLVNDLLDVSRIEQGRVVNKPQKVNIYQTIEKIYEEVDGLAKQKKLNMTIEAEDKNLEIVVDPIQFREVVTNLVSNAIKYNKIAGVVTVIIKKVEGGVKLDVTDTGAGIPKEEQEKIFSKFYRGSKAIRDETEGSGLGLFVVRSYVEAWGGKVSFESQPDQGSIFTVFVPVKHEESTSS